MVEFLLVVIGFILIGIMNNLADINKTLKKFVKEDPSCSSTTKTF
jgi:hypothetical protein